MQESQNNQSNLEQGQSQQNSDFVAAPNITLPKGGGAIRGIGEKFAANPVTGTGSMTVPIATSPGRSGFGPQLSLSYDSGAGNGPFGLGWNLSIPSITRKTDKGLPKYQDAIESDEFILSGAEDLVPVLKKQGNDWLPEEIPDRTVDSETYRIQRYRPRIEGLFARIERWTNLSDPTDTFWRSISKDNITTWYGKTSESRIFDPENPDHIFSWLICESHDDKGNVIVYGYEKENLKKVDLSQANEKNRTEQSRSTNRYLKRIRYGNHTPYFPELIATSPWPQPPGATASDASSHWFFEVVFDYGEHDSETPMPHDSGAWDIRHDPFSTYRAGFEVRNYRLCQRVLMFHHFPDEEKVGANCLVRSTDFNYRYEQEPADPRNPIHTVLTSVTQCGYRRQTGGSYFKKTMPPVEFEYSQAVLGTEIKNVESDSIENLPYGVDGSLYQWLDLDGEGLSGVLTEQGGAWFYKNNESPITRSLENDTVHYEAQLGAMQTVASMPSGGLSGVSNRQFLDLAGDGHIDLVELDRPTSGFYERTHEQGWQTFRAFQKVPNIDWHDPNLKFIDLTGDGHADIVITEHEALTWYPSLAEAGFAESERVSIPTDEEQGPRVVFADGTQTIFQADLSGDGLTDIVRIRNGEVCYWPNLGYGRFASKVTMDDAPWFDNPDQFDPRRIRLADIDGSGVTDIIYLGRNKTQFWYNQSGNTWSAPQILDRFPSVDNIASVAVVDLLGNGTACLVWSSPLPGESHSPMRYLELMADGKPHLMITSRNNLGAKTHVQYVPSTYFYLKDKREGKPWITRLPFPVHVVEWVETHDRISKNRFVTRYAYHHGYFDGVEREFRGFGMVEQWDTEEYAAIEGNEDFLSSTNFDESSYIPPAHTKTWFHTGAYLGGAKISLLFAQEYYGAPSPDDPEFDENFLNFVSERLLPDTLLEPDLSVEEAREACRALKGSMLRQEVYADDDTDKAEHPYTVTEQNFTVSQLQPREDNPHGVFFTHPREAISYHYERNPDNPRITHALTLEVDEFGNVLKSVAIGYGRFSDVTDEQLSQEDRDKQKLIHITCTENEFTRNGDTGPITDPASYPDDYRTPLPCETRTYELRKPEQEKSGNGSIDLYLFDEVSEYVNQAGDGDHDVAYEDIQFTAAQEAVSNNPEESNRYFRRLIEQVRTLYRANNLSGPLNLGDYQSRALPYESYKLALTPELVSRIYLRTHDDEEENLLPDPDSVLAGEAGYVHSEGDSNWWIPSGKVYYPPDSDTPHDTDAVLAYAKEHFFLPHRFEDPFGNSSVVTYDAAANGREYDLLVTSVTDPIGNQTQVEHDYRVLQPSVIIDPNHNHSEVIFDTLGMVAGSAIMGKVDDEDGQSESGDSLETFVTDLNDDELAEFMEAPRTEASDLLGNATTRIVYNLNNYINTGQPIYAATIARENHVNDDSNPESRPQISFSYSDGFGREIQKKIQAEPEKINGTVGSPRWVGSGWTIFNNKGKPVRQYEPFFSELPAEERHCFEFGMRVGVSPILFYDPVGRVVATLHPNNTYEKVIFDPWRQITYDVNDTVCASVEQPRQTGDPRTDPDIEGYVGEYFTTQPETWQTWYQQRIDGANGTNEQRAAEKAAAHANTPTTACFDSLGRPFLTIAHNRVVCPNHEQDGTEGKYETRVELDIESNQRSVRDAKKITHDAQGNEVIDELGRIVMHYDYDMLGNRIHQISMEAGERWMLNDVTGNPIYAWDCRNHTFRTEYDVLRRPVRAFVQGAVPDGPPDGILYQQTVYGEDQTDDDVALNLRTRVFLQYDGAGIVTSMGTNLETNQQEAYDFKGNLLRSSRQLTVEYKEPPNWSDEVNLEENENGENILYTSSTLYDALNRPVALTTPDNSVTRPRATALKPI